MAVEDTSGSDLNISRQRAALSTSVEATGGVSIPKRPPQLELDDIRFLLDETRSRIACFTFYEPLDTRLPREQFVDRLWAAPSGCLSASATFAADLGFADRTTLVGRPFADLFPANEVNFEIINTWYSSGLSSDPIIARFTPSDGNLKYFHFYFHAQIQDCSCSKLWIVARDVTRQRQALLELKHAEEHYRTLVERPGLILLRTSPDGMVLYVSPHVQNLLGYTAEDFESQPALIKTLLHPEDTERYARLVTSRKKRETRTIESEYRVRFVDGGYHWIFERQSPKVHADGTIEYYDSVILDIQEKKQLENQLFHMQRMETIGSLTGGLAHDFNNYLAAIMGQLSLALEKLTEDHPAYRCISLAEQATLNCSAMSRRLLSFGRATESNKEPISTTDLLESTERLLRHAVPAEINTEIFIPEGIGSITGNYTELQQVLLNLGINARDAMPDGGTISISVSNYTTDKGNERWPNAATGNYVEVKIQDTGYGIPPAHLELIFDPYFTTKQADNGSGLGLSLSYAIVQAHEGCIHVESSVGEGSTFWLLLPATTAEVTRVRSEGRVAPGGSEHVLVVDDDPLVLAMVQAALSSQGYSVLCASSAEEACRVFEERHSTLALAMLDYSMHASRGDTVAKFILERDAGFPILLTSGYGKNLFDIPVQADHIDFLAKPYPVAELLYSVRHLIDLANKGK